MELPGIISSVCNLSTMLSLKDIIHLTMVTKKFSELYPRHISYTFRESATQEDYDNFAKALARHDVVSIDIRVRPLLWFRAAGQFLQTKRFDSASVFPITPEMMTCRWSCFQEGCVSGILIADVPPEVKFNPATKSLTLTNHTTTAVTLPVILASDVAMLCLIGPFTGIDAVDHSIPVCYRRRHFSRDSLTEALSHPLVKFGSNCTFDDTCVNIDAYCKKLVLDGDMTVLTRIGCLWRCHEIEVMVMKMCRFIIPPLHEISSGPIGVKVSGTAAADWVPRLREYFSELLHNFQGIRVI